MSGQQIGTVIGGVIGAFFDAPQLGMAIGGLIGGAIDPEKINGPHIGQGQVQTSSPGVPIAWVQGTAKIAGTLAVVGKRYEVKVKESGKGGPEVSNYEAHQNYAVLVCESSELKGSTIDAVVMVEQDGKIVYDVRPSSKMIADSQKWKANYDFTYGAEDQLPHPTLEMIAATYGVQAPAYRGVCMMVAKDVNISSFGDRIPQYVFTVASSTEDSSLDNELEDYTIPSPGLDSGLVSTGGTGNVFVGNKTYSIIEHAGCPAIGDYRLTYAGDTDAPFWAWGLLGLRAHAFVPSDLTTAPVTGSDAAAIINSKVANIYLDWDTGWNYYYYPAAMPTDVVHDWFVSEGLATPTTEGNGIAGVPINITAREAQIIEGVEVVEVEGDLTEFDCIARRPNATFALTGGKNLVRFDGVYWQDIDDGSIWRPSWVAAYSGSTSDPLNISLADMVTAICRRGGLNTDQIDVTALAETVVAGYPIATQCDATQALAPLLQSYFAFGTECDGKILFKFYGEDAIQTVSRDDLVVNDATDGAISMTRRNQATEFPQKIVASFIDPDQNYDTNTVTAERLASTVIAIGESDLQIPVTMDADQAAQAADKALKVAYAALEGTQDYSTPFATPNADYLTLCAGEPLFMDGKRWVVDGMTLSNMTIKFETRYDRQSAYTSNVQAVKPNPPLPPDSPYSGPTILLPMNLPSLRPQDTYGVYIAAKGVQESWKGCTVQVSYDGMASWVNAVTIGTGSIMGNLAEDETEDSNGTETTVDIGETDALESVTPDQLDAQANAYAVVDSSDTAEIRQFQTATMEDTSNGVLWELTAQRTGLLGTTHKDYAINDRFTMLDSVYFLPIDTSFKGKTLYFRGVGFGEVAEDQQIVQLVYNPDTTVIIDGGTVTP